MAHSFIKLDRDPKPKFKKLGQEEKADLSDEGLTAFGVGAAQQIAQNLGNIPANLLEGGADMFLGLPPNVQDMADKAGVVPPMEHISAAIDENLRPGDQPLSGLMESLGVDQFGEFSEELEEQNPMADLAGQLGGDVATLFGFRNPIKKSIERDTGKTSGGLLDEFVDEALTRFSKRAGAGAGNTGVRKEIQELVDGDNFRTLARGAGRGMEAGLEGAMLAAMDEQDPWTVAGYSAGAQLLSSAALTAGAASVELPAKVLFKQDVGKVTKVGAALAIQGTILGAWLNFFTDNPDEATATAFDKLGFGMLSALALGLPGKRPKDDGLLRNFPGAADAVLTTPRAAVHNGIMKMVEAGDERLQPVVDLMQTDPMRMGEGEFRRMQAAAEQGAFDEWVADVYERYNLDDTMQGLTPEAAAAPIRRRNRGPGFDR